jgi:preprotein translocase subunit SecG
MVNRRGEVSWELVRTLIFIAVLVIMVFVAVVFLRGKGGDLLSSLGKLLRFGRG